MYISNDIWNELLMKVYEYKQNRLDKKYGLPTLKKISLRNRFGIPNLKRKYVFFYSILFLP